MNSDCLVMGNKVVKPIDRDYVDGIIAKNWTVLYLASDAGDEGVLDFLLQRGTSIEALDKHGLSALCLAFFEF